MKNRARRLKLSAAALFVAVVASSLALSGQAPASAFSTSATKSSKKAKATRYKKIKRVDTGAAPEVFYVSFTYGPQADDRVPVSVDLYASAGTDQIDLRWVYEWHMLAKNVVWGEGSARYVGTWRTPVGLIHKFHISYELDKKAVRVGEHAGMRVDHVVSRIEKRVKGKLIPAAVGPEKDWSIAYGKKVYPKKFPF